MNNFEKIKAMDIDEMAEMILLMTECDNKDCDECMFNNLCFTGRDIISNIKQWLLEEV